MPRENDLGNNILQAYADIRNLMENSGAWLQDMEATRLYTAGRLLLNSYKALSWEAQQNNQARWQLKPKHHHYFEGLRYAYFHRRNPAYQWLYKHEDAVGRVARMAAKAHPSTCAVRALERWLLNFCVNHLTPVAPTPPVLRPWRNKRLRSGRVKLR